MSLLSQHGDKLVNNKFSCYYMKVWNSCLLNNALLILTDMALLKNNSLSLAKSSIQNLVTFAILDHHKHNPAIHTD